MGRKLRKVDPQQQLATVQVGMRGMRVSQSRFLVRLVRRSKLEYESWESEQLVIDTFEITQSCSCGRS